MTKTLHSVFASTAKQTLEKQRRETLTRHAAPLVAAMGEMSRVAYRLPADQKLEVSYDLKPESVLEENKLYLRVAQNSEELLIAVNADGSYDFLAQEVASDGSFNFYGSHGETWVRRAPFVMDAVADLANWAEKHIPAETVEQYLTQKPGWIT